MWWSCMMMFTDTKSHFCTSICLSGSSSALLPHLSRPTTGGGYRAQLCSGEGLTDSGRRSARVVGPERSRSLAILPFARRGMQRVRIKTLARKTWIMIQYRRRYMYMFIFLFTRTSRSCDRQADSIHRIQSRGSLKWMNYRLLAISDISHMLHLTLLWCESDITNGLKQDAI